MRRIRIIAGRELMALGITLSTLGVVLLTGSGWRSWSDPARVGAR